MYIIRYDFQMAFFLSPMAAHDSFGTTGPKKNGQLPVAYTSDGAAEVETCPDDVVRPRDYSRAQTEAYEAAILLGLQVLDTVHPPPADPIVSGRVTVTQ